MGRPLLIGRRGAKVLLQQIGRDGSKVLGVRRDFEFLPLHRPQIQRPHSPGNPLLTAPNALVLEGLGDSGRTIPMAVLRKDGLYPCIQVLVRAITPTQPTCRPIVIPAPGDAQHATHERIGQAFFYFSIN